MKRPSSGGDATQHPLIHSEGCGVPNYLPGHTGAKWSHMLVISTKETLSSHFKKKKKKNALFEQIQNKLEQVSHPR